MDPTSSVAAYKEFIGRQLCWIDGTPTHASSDLQRQCPKCRTKWSYERLSQELAAMEAFCEGVSASGAARKVGCVKNTALGHYQGFRRFMEELVADHLLNGSIATYPTSLPELKSLEKALRAGSSRRRERSCRHLFLASLTLEERLEMLFQARIVPEVKSRMADATRRLERRGEPEEMGRHYAQPTGGLRSRVHKPLREILRDGWISFWRDLRARLDPSCPYPSQACGKLGKKWVQVWERAREVRLGEADRPRK